MSIIDSIRMSQRRQAMLASGAAVEMLAPTAVAGLVVSIGDVMQNGKSIQYQRMLNSAFKKIKHAVLVANRDKAVPKLALEAEESEAMETLIGAVKSGFSTAIETLCEGLFSFIPFAIETVVAPLFTLASWTIAAVLPLILTPEGLAVVGTIALGTFFYKRWKAWESGESEGEYKPAEPQVPSLRAFQPSAAGVPPSTAAEAPMTGLEARGFRNNNPGNLRYAQQPGALPQSGPFAQFATQGQGLYNLGRQIELNYSRGTNTVTSMISTWAPATENKTKEYIADVSQRMNVKADDKLDLGKQEVLAALMKAIIIHENGSCPYSDAQIAEAAAQALGFAANGYKDQGETDVRLVYPTSGVISSPFGHREKPIEGASTEHQGVDIAGSEGTAVVAAAAGTVEVERESSSYGNFIQLKHASFWTRYGHLSAFNVKQGEAVVAGQKIGTMGSTGVSTGAHLHFEVQPFTSTHPVDPATYLASLGRGSHVAASEVKPAPIAVAPSDKLFIKQGDRIITLNS